MALRRRVLDSGPAVSLLRQDVLKQATGIERADAKLDIHLVTAAGAHLPIVDQVSVTELEKWHNFLEGCKPDHSCHIVNGFSSKAWNSPRFCPPCQSQ